MSTRLARTMAFNSKKSDFSLELKSMEDSNLFQRRILHAENNHNYDFVELESEKELKIYKSNTNTPKTTDKNDNNLNLSQMKKKSPGAGSDKMNSSMGKSVKFEIRSGLVNHAQKFALKTT